MKTLIKLLIVIACQLSIIAADLTGTWKAEFATQIGVQKYTFTLKQDGTNVTGKASSDIAGEKHEVELKDGKLAGDTVAFVEMLPFQGDDRRITYKGKIVGDEIKFTRKVDDVITEELTAKREAAAQPPAAAGPRGGRRAQQPIVLGPDDKAAFPAAPEGFDKPRDGIAHGKIETVEYDSKSVGNKRKMLIYTPPGYSTNTKYPVLYLLHGIGGDEEEWYRHGAPEAILDNLLADKKIVPMIVVLPNGRAQPDDRAGTNPFATAPAFAKFDQDLLNDVIPFVESKY
jgi:hypothetical protein